MPQNEVRMPDAARLAGEMINRWLDATRGMPTTLQLTRLGFAVVAELEAAYQAGVEAAYQAGVEAALKAKEEQGR